MVKKLLTIVLGLLLTTGIKAQVSPSDILYWVGTGDAHAIVVIQWDEDEVGLAWGINYDEEMYLSVQDALDTIAAYDARFSYQFSIYGGWTIMGFSSLNFNDGTLNLSKGNTETPCVWVEGYQYSPSDWDFDASVEEENGIILISTGCIESYTGIDPVTPSDIPMPEDATIAFDDILYWVGEGSDSAVLIVNFGIPDTAFAWGYRFNGSATVQQMTDAITAADPRFWVVDRPSYYPDGDIFFVISTGDTLKLSGRDEDNPWNYWEANINGGVSQSGAEQTLVNGDVFKYGDQRSPSRFCVETMMTYCMHAVWTKTPTPVPEPAPAEATIAANDILYWVGEGNDSAILVMDFGTNAIAWGYRFDGEKTAYDMVNAVDAADPRFAVSLDWVSFGISGFHYCDYPLHLYMLDSYRMMVNGVLADEDDELSDVDIEDGMLLKIGQSATSPWTTSIVAATQAVVPVASTISADRIEYWVGSGNDSAIVAINWGNPDTALAWGLLFNESIWLTDAFMAISNADPRLTISASYMATYVDGDITLTFQTTPAGNTPQFILDGNGYAGYNDPLHNGSFLKLGESAYGQGIDSCYWEGSGWFPNSVVWSTEIHPVSAPVEPAPEDATIAAEEILYWVGEGDNKVVFAINWADTALAWGYKFSTDSVFVSEIIGAIVRTDPRLNIVGDSAFISDFRYADANITDSLTITPHDPSDWSIYFNMQVNHVSSMIGAGGHKVGNGDFVKFADTYVAVKADSVWIEDGEYSYWSYTYVYPMEIHPVSVPQNVGIMDVAAVIEGIMPNPTTDYVNVSVSRAVEAVLYDLSGRRMAVYSLNEGINRLDLTAFQSGVYMLRTEGAVSKIVKR